MSEKQTRVIIPGRRIDLPPIPKWVGYHQCPMCEAIVDIGEDWSGEVTTNDIDATTRVWWDETDEGDARRADMVITCPACHARSIPAKERGQPQAPHTWGLTLEASTSRAYLLATNRRKQGPDEVPDLEPEKPSRRYSLTDRARGIGLFMVGVGFFATGTTLDMLGFSSDIVIPIVAIFPVIWFVVLLFPGKDKQPEWQPGRPKTPVVGPPPAIHRPRSEEPIRYDNPVVYTLEGDNKVVAQIYEAPDGRLLDIHFHPYETFLGTIYEQTRTPPPKNPRLIGNMDRATPLPKAKADYTWR